ncbi:MAG: valine--tRNA ligase [Desulfurococcales archaeon]|nr:valine--tRNA ligase [Desulfurococcales archaeon]
MGSLKPIIEEKRWNIEWERELIEVWEKEGIYKPPSDVPEGKDIVVIDTPPPYASGRWHVAGTAHYAQIDMVARYLRLKGYVVIVPFYADRNGLPVEVQVEKTYKVNAHEMARTVEGRRKFLDLCRRFLDEAEREIVSIWKRIGCSFDYWTKGTDSKDYRVLTQRSFIELYKRGLIYEGERPVRWCPRCRTTLAEAEIERHESEGTLYYVRFELKDREGYVVVATTRPELLAGCAALAFNPEDERYKELKGGKAVAPIYGHELPILEHPSVDPGFGTGLMMICSYGDENDVRLFSELGLKPRVVVGEDGKMLESSGPIRGLKVEEARVKIAEILEKAGYLVKREKIIHSTPVCWRCKTPLQIIHRRELFLKQLEFRDKVKEVASKIEFYPEMHRSKLYEWIDSITMDWPISRDRFYGTEIPMWTCSRCGEKLVPEPGRYYRPWEEPPPWDRCPKCGAPASHLIGEKRVFDTWFDSSISVLYVSRWSVDNDFFNRAFRFTIRPQGQDIIRTWLYYSLLRVYQLTGKPAFKMVRITGMGLDPKGRPMHKSLGNIIDPEPVVEAYGADAFRFWSAVASKLGYDYRYDENKVKTGRNFVTKLWNLARLLSSFPWKKDAESLEGFEPVDRAFIAVADDYLEKADRAYSALDVYEPAHLLYELAWDVFASHYVELVKERAYNRDGGVPSSAQESAWQALHTVFKRVLVALSPIMPFVTDAIFRRLYGESVHVQRYPEPLTRGKEREELVSLAKSIMELNHEIWNYKKSLGLRLSEELRGYKVYVPENLAVAAADLSRMHKVYVEASNRPPPGARPLGSAAFIMEPGEA